MTNVITLILKLSIPERERLLLRDKFARNKTPQLAINLLLKYVSLEHVCINSDNLKEKDLIIWRNLWEKISTCSRIYVKSWNRCNEDLCRIDERWSKVGKRLLISRHVSTMKIMSVYICACARHKSRPKYETTFFITNLSAFTFYFFIFVLVSELID